MKTSVFDVREMLSVLSVDEVEKRIGEVPGVESVTVNFAGGNATARYDETRLDIADIKSSVRQRGFESAEPAPDVGGDSHSNHTSPSAPPTTPKPADSKTLPDAPAAAGPASPGTSDNGVKATIPKPPLPAAAPTPVAQDQAAKS